MVVTAAAFIAASTPLAAAALCPAGDRARSAAEAASRRAAWIQELRFAETAASAYGRCARGERPGADYEWLVFMKGISLTFASGGAAGAYGPSQALRAANGARTLFRQVALSPDAAADIRARSNELRAGIGRQLPGLAKMRLDAAVIPAPAVRRPALALSGLTPAAPQIRATDVPTSYPTAPTAPFDVLTTWYTPGDGNVAYVHVRVNVHPTREVQLQADEFRIAVDSPTGGRETVYGYMGRAPLYQVTNYLAQGYPVMSKPAVAQNEDLGAGAIRLRAGDSVTTVVTFRVRADADRSEAVARSLTWFPRIP